MLRTIIKLQDGTEISSGSNTVNAIQSSTITECVNSNEDLTIGSTCAGALEVTLITPEGGLSIPAGTRVEVLKQDGDNAPFQVGVFNLEKPTRHTANTMKLTGYDRVAELDKDLTDWLNDLYKKEQWAYTLTEFASMVCTACGLNFKVSDVPNADFAVPRFTRSAVTGRQLMQWLGEICCRFCRADAYGNIEFAWYEHSGKTITPTGELYYLQNGLSFEDYKTAKVEAVQLRLANSTDGALWPEAAKGANSYIITDNAILNARITDELRPYLQVIRDELTQIQYTPCKVTVPICRDIHAGSIVDVVDKNGATMTMLVMTKTQKGQQDTLECTGNSRRDTATAVSNQPKSAEAAVQDAFAGMTQEQIFQKLTDNGRIQGLFMKDGQMYVNVAFLAAGIIASADGTVKIDLANNFVTIDGEKNGYKTQIKLSASGMQGFSENTAGEMEHVLDFDMGAGGRPLGLWNVSWQENRGLSLGTVEGELSIGTTTSPLSIFGSEITLSSIWGAVIAVTNMGAFIEGKKVSWKDNGDGTYTLIGQ